MSRSIRSRDRRSARGNRPLSRYAYGSTNQSITITDMISEGPIKGLVNGGQSIYLNDDAFFSGGSSPYNVEVHRILNTAANPEIFTIDTKNTPFVQYEIQENTSPFLRIFKVWKTGGANYNNAPGPITTDSIETNEFRTRITLTHSISTTVGDFPAADGYSTEYNTEEFDKKAFGTLFTEKGSSFNFVVESYNSTTRQMVINMNPAPYEETELNSIFSIFVHQMFEIESIEQKTITLTTGPGVQLIGPKSFEITGFQLDAEVSDKFSGKGFQFVTGNAINPLLSSPLGVGSATVNLSTANVGDLDKQTARQVSTSAVEPFDIDLINKITATPATNASEIDKVQLLFTYPGGLYATNTENGDKFSAGAGYKIYARFDKVDDGATTYGDWVDLGGNYNPDKVTVEELNENVTDTSYYIENGDRIIAHGGKYTSGVTFSHVIDLTPYQPYAGFQIGVRRVTNSEDITDNTNGRAHSWNYGGRHKLQWFGTNIQKWQAVQSGGISQAIGIINEKLNYPYTAIANVNFRGKDFSDTPTRGYECYGLLVKIPSNYITREEAEPDANGNPKGPDELYQGIWDGEFQKNKQYTNNPAWVFYDILTNNRYGVGNFVRAEDIDKWALYKIARYCDELVPNGKGGLEPRFTANVYLSKATDVYKVLKDMATIFRGMLYWADGKLFPVIDEKKYPIYNFNRSNVIKGQFEYESSATNVRTNQVIVQWNNPESNFALEPLLVEDRQNIVQTGKIIQDEVTAFGCTSEGQAIRYGRWKLWTAINQTDIVSFQTSINGAFLAPGDIINVQDNHDYNLAYSGRIRSATTSSLSLDREIDVSSGKITVLFPDNKVILSQDSATIGATSYVAGDEIREAIDENGLSYSTLAATSISTYALINNAYDDSGNIVQLQYNEATAIRELDIASVSNSTVTLSDTLTSEEATKVVSQVFGIQDTNQSEASYKEYKILSIAKEEDSLYGITAVEYYAGKFDVVDYNFSIAQRDPVFPEPLDTDTVPVPESVSVIATPDFTRPGEEVVFSWKKPENYLEALRYEVSHNVSDYPTPITQGNTSVTFGGLREGIYTFRVTAIDGYGRRSDTVEREVYIEDTFENNKNRLYGLIEGGYTTSRVFIDSANTELKFEGGSVSLLPFDGTPSDLYTFTTPTLDYSALGANEVGYVVANLAESTLYLVKWLQDTALGLDYWYDVNVTEANRWTSIDTNTSFSSINGVPTLVTTSTSPTLSALNLTNVLKLEDTAGSDSGDYGARVTSLVSSSSIEISRAPTSSTGASVKPSGTLYRDSLNLDFSKDFLLGSIDGSGNWKSYLVLDPDLQPARSVLINSSKAVLEYTGSADNATQENTPSSIDVKVTAVGFTSPEFRIQTSSGLTYTPSVSFSASNGTDAFVYEFSTTDGVVAYNSGTAELITASVREAGAVNNFNRGATFEITKTRSGNDGVQGDPGNTVVGVTAYSRSSAVITSNPGAVTVSLSTGQITTATLANGWSKTIPAGSNPLYITTATAAGQITPSSDTDTIAAGEWATPVVLAENGTNGDPGATARSVLIYQRTATNSAPANTPTGNTTYEIATNSAVFTTANGWSTDISGTDPYLWVSQATALSASARDIIPDTEWAAIELLASDGDQGDPGLRTVAGNLYYEKSTTPGTPPNAPTGTITYRFADGSVSSSTAGQIGTGVNIWTNEPRTQDPTSANVHYRLSYYGTEAAANSNTVTLSLASVTQFTEFTGVVSFTDLSAAGTTEIHGANISTGQITLGSGDGLGHIKAGKTSYSSQAAGFYLGFDPEETNSSAALLHLGDGNQSLKWTGSALQVRGVIASDAIEVNPSGQLILGTGSTVEGDLQATTVVAGGVNVAALGQDVVNFIDSRVSSTVGSSFTGYYVRNLSTTAFANAPDQDYLLNRDADGNVVANVERGSGDITAKLVANKTWTSPLERTYLSLSAEFLYKLDAASTWTSIGSRIPMSITSTYIDLFGEDLYVYTLTVNNQQTLTGLVEGSDYDWKLNVKVGNTTGSPLGLAGSSATFEASVLEGAAGSISVSSSGTADNANTLDGLDSSQFLRSDANDTFGAGRTLTINGNLLTNSSVQLAGAVQLTGLSSSTETLALMISSVGGNVSTRTLGTNAFNSTSYLPTGGGTMNGNITFTNDEQGVVWSRNTDGAGILFYNTGDSDTNSRLEYYTRDNGNEYHRWVHFTPSACAHELMTLRYSNSAGDLVVTRNITANGTLSGSTLSIAANGTISGNLTIVGDLDVNGSITTIDSSIVSISAKTITVARNATNSTQADGAGLFVEGVDASILYQNSNSAFLINHDLDVFTSGTQGTMRVGRNGNEYIELDTVDRINKITAVNDADENGDHEFILNREFLGTGRSDFRIQAGGTTQVSIDAAGNTGIGTETPIAKLDVNGAAIVNKSNGSLSAIKTARYMGYSFNNNPTTLIYGYSSSTANSVIIGGGTGLGEPANSIIFRTETGIGVTGNGTEAMRVTSQQRVGIGTSNPLVDLDVRGTTWTYGSGDGTLVQRLGVLSDNANNSLFNIYTDDDGTTRPLGGDALEFNTARWGSVFGQTRSSPAGGNIRSWKFLTVLDGDERGTDLIIYSQPDSQTSASGGTTTTNGNVQISALSGRDSYINTTGNFMLGTSTSLDNTAKLHIAGKPGGYARITMSDVDGTNQKTYFTQSFGLTTLTTQDNTNNGEFAIAGFNGATTTNFVRVDSAGKVGIGTDAPAHRLTISASSDGDGSWTEGILVENTGSGAEAALSYRTANTSTNYWITGINQSDAYDIAYGTVFQNGTTKMRIKTDGTVGIGTVAPAVALQVGEAAQSNDYAIRTYYNDSSYTELRGYGLQSSRGTTYIRSTGNGTASLIFGGTSGSSDQASQDWGSVFFRVQNGVYFEKSDVQVKENLSVLGNITTGNNSAIISTRKLAARDTNGLAIATSDGTSRVDLLNSGELRINRNSDLIIQTESSNTAGLLIFDNVDGTYDWWNYQTNESKLNWTITGTGGAEMALSANGTSHSSAVLTIGGGIGVGGEVDVSRVDANNVFVNAVRGLSDNNTQIEFLGSDVTRFIQGGSEKARIDANGRLGIGSSGPDKALVVSASGDTAEIVINDTTGTPTLRFRNAGSTIGSINASASDMTFINASRGLYFGASQLRPFNADTGAIDIGSESARFNKLFLDNAINFGPPGTNPTQILMQYSRCVNNVIGTVTLMQRHDELGATSFGGDNTTIIGAGEGRLTAVNNLGGFSGEQLYLVAESGINFATSPDNWDNGTSSASSWTGRNSMVFDTSGTLAVSGGGTFGDDVTITGQLNATTKSFLINHPTKEGMKLRYGSLEGPENGVYVRGRATTNVIELPDYWTGLVDETTITVQLTANGRFQKLFVDKIENNKVYLKNASWFSNKVDCYYNVYGERKDVEKLEVEY